MTTLANLQSQDIIRITGYLDIIELSRCARISNSWKKIILDGHAKLIASAKFKKFVFHVRDWFMLTQRPHSNNQRHPGVKIMAKLFGPDFDESLRIVEIFLKLPTFVEYVSYLFVLHAKAHHLIDNYRNPLGKYYFTLVSDLYKAHQQRDRISWDHKGQTQLRELSEISNSLLENLNPHVYWNRTMSDSNISDLMKLYESAKMKVGEMNEQPSEYRGQDIIWIELFLMHSLMRVMKRDNLKAVRVDNPPDYYVDAICEVLSDSNCVLEEIELSDDLRIINPLVYHLLDRKEVKAVYLNLKDVPDLENQLKKINLDDKEHVESLHLRLSKRESHNPGAVVTVVIQTPIIKISKYIRNLRIKSTCGTLASIDSLQNVECLDIKGVEMTKFLLNDLATTKSLKNLTIEYDTAVFHQGLIWDDFLSALSCNDSIETFNLDLIKECDASRITSLLKTIAPLKRIQNLHINVCTSFLDLRNDILGEGLREFSKVRQDLISFEFNCFFNSEDDLYSSTNSWNMSTRSITGFLHEFAESFSSLLNDGKLKIQTITIRSFGFFCREFCQNISQSKSDRVYKYLNLFGTQESRWGSSELTDLSSMCDFLFAPNLKLEHLSLGLPSIRDLGKYGIRICKSSTLKSLTFEMDQGCEKEIDNRSLLEILLSVQHHPSLKSLKFRTSNEGKNSSMMSFNIFTITQGIELGLVGTEKFFDISPSNQPVWGVRVKQDLKVPDHVDNSCLEQLEKGNFDISKLFVK